MSELYDFKTLSEQHTEILENVLTGNGFSRHFHDEFSYGSLFDYIKETQKLREEEAKIFLEFQTQNFELVLNSLSNAKIINNAFDKPIEHLNESYEKIKNLLIDSVNGIHPKRYEIEDLNELAWCFYIFKKNIFTTNYDLLSYWALTEIYKAKRKDPYYIGDYFKGRYLTFNPEEFDEFKIKVHYLHGALHLFDIHGDIYKIKADKKEDILTKVTKMYSDNKFPIYVAEGSSEEKVIQIKRNKYLSFCFKKFEEMKGGITIIGQSLEKKYDSHIIEAIKNSNVDHIAFGVYQTEEESAPYIMEKIKNHFKSSKKKIHFFDSHGFFDSVKKIAQEIKPGFGSYLEKFPDLK
ncbi:DUF4917 family protein [Bacillus sp. S10C12M]|uniref:DUF4917 family protein n=1 Tax=Bacillus sp. S10C12M TaxID=2918906 RepID=UPI0022858DA6|nr:DUF4917 family protein [Bacillus sp. S10C12M]